MLTEFYMEFLIVMLIEFSIFDNGNNYWTFMSELKSVILRSLKTKSWASFLIDILKVPGHFTFIPRGPSFYYFLKFYNCRSVIWFTPLVHLGSGAD